MNHGDASMLSLYGPSGGNNSSIFDDDYAAGNDDVGQANSLDSTSMLSADLYSEPTEHLISTRQALLQCVPPTVRFHGKSLLEMLEKKADEARAAAARGGLHPEGPGAPLPSLSLSSSMLDTDKLRRIWPLSTVFPLLQHLDVSGNLIHTIEGPHLSGLHHLTDLDLARNKLKSLRGVEALAGSLRRLDASGNLIDSIADGALGRCVLLEDVSLAGNNLRHPQELEGLSRLAHLGTLDLRVNPVSGTPSGRLFAVYHLQSLAQLDGTHITQAERQAAHERYGGLSMELLQDQLKKKEDSAKKSLSKAAEAADELRRENESLKVALRVKSQLLENATGTATQARHELMTLQEEMESLRIDAMDDDHHYNHHHLDDGRQQPRQEEQQVLLIEQGSVASKPPRSPYTPHRDRSSSSSRRSGSYSVSREQELRPEPTLWSGDEATRHVPAHDALRGAPLDMPPIRRLEIGEEGAAAVVAGGCDTITFEDALWTSPQHTGPRPPPRHFLDTEDYQQQQQQQQEARREGTGEEEYTHVNEDWRGCPAFEAPSHAQYLIHHQSLLSGERGGPVPTARELEEAQDKLRTQRQVLREQIHTKRGHLGRIRACLSVLGQQLQEARREAGDDEGQSTTTPADSRGAHRSSSRNAPGRKMLLDEKSQAHAKLQRHMQVLESRLQCLRDELSARTTAFISTGGKSDETPSHAGPAAGLRYEDALVELSKEVELTQDEISKVASQLCRLRSEMETLGCYVQGRVSPTYLAASSTTGASPSSFCPSPMQLRGALSLRELEEGGGRLRRFATEVATDFILRLKQRISSAKLLEDKVQTELDQLEREIDQAGRILAQLQRQQMQHELAVARQESRISKQQVQTLLRALQQASTSDEIEALAGPAAMAQKTTAAASTATTTTTTTTASTTSSTSPTMPAPASRAAASDGTGRGPVKQQKRVHASTSTSPTITAPPPSSSAHTRSGTAAVTQASQAGSTKSSLPPPPPPPPPFDLEAAGALDHSAGGGAPPLDLSPRSCYQRIRALEQQLEEARDREEMVAETGIAVDRRSRTPLGRLEVSVVRTGGWSSRGGRPGSSSSGSSGGPFYVVITMDPITSCFGRTGAFGSHPAGSYLFRSSSSKHKGSDGSLAWNDKFVVKPVLTRQAVLKLVLMDESPSRAGKSRDHVVAEAGVPLVSLVDQRPHLFWLPMAPPEQTGSKRKHPSSASTPMSYLSSSSSIPQLYYNGTSSGEAMQGNHNGNPVCNLRVRVRFEYSRVALLLDRLEQLHSTVQARGYDLNEVGREVMEEDAVRHGHAADYEEPLHHHHCHPSSPPRPTTATTVATAIGTGDMTAKRTTPRHQDQQHHRHHHLDRQATSPALDRSEVGQPPAKAMRGAAGNRTETTTVGNTTACSFLFTSVRRGSPGISLSSSAAFTEPPLPPPPPPVQPFLPPTPAARPSTPQADDSTVTSRSSSNGNKRAVLSTLYDSIVHLKSIATLQRQALSSSSSSCSSIPHPGTQTTQRPSATECFDVDSPYHPSFSATMLAQPPPPQPLRPPPQPVAHFASVTHPLPSSSSVAATTYSSFIMRRAASSSAFFASSPNPGSRSRADDATPLSDRAGAQVPVGGGVVADDQSRFVDDEGEGRLQLDHEQPFGRSSSSSATNLGIFKTPATRRMQPNNKPLPKSSTSLIAGRLIGIDNHETRWRKEMCRRFSTSA